MRKEIDNATKIEKYYLTRKIGKGKVREENTEVITEEEYMAKINKLIGNIIKKTRAIYSIHNSSVAEVDIYHDIDLMTVEVEFRSYDDSEKFIPPKWFGREITYDKKYKNKNIATSSTKLIGDRCYEN